MPTPTYTLIDSEVLASAAASVTFTSIPADYRDLVLVTEILGDGGSANLTMRLNSDSGFNYYTVAMNGDGTSATSSSANQNVIVGVGGTTTLKGLTIFQFMDYSATDKHKSVLSRANRTDAVANARATRWEDTSAVNSISIEPSSNNYAAGSTFHLYGIAS